MSKHDELDESQLIQGGVFDNLTDDELREDFDSITNYLRDLSDRDFRNFIRSVNYQRRADKCRERMNLRVGR